MLKFRPPKQFSFMYEKQRIKVELTTHLFNKRVIQNKADTKKRIWIFRTKNQIISLLLTSFKEHELMKFVGKGNTALIFSYNENKYGLLLNLRKESRGIYIKIITIDKIDSRHYHFGEIFRKEGNKIYTDFILPISYLFRIQEVTMTIKNFQFMHTEYFNKVAKSSGYIDEVAHTNLHNAIIARIEQGKLQYNCYWLDIPLEDNNSIYLRVSIEHVDRNTGVIFIDAKRSRERTKQRAEMYNEDIVEFGRNVHNRGFKLDRVEKTERKGLNIKKKYHQK